MLSSQSCTQSRVCFLVTLDVSSRAIFAVRVLQSPLMSRSCRRCSHRLRGSSWKARRASGIFVTSQIQARSKYKGLSSRWVPLSRTGWSQQITLFFVFLLVPPPWPEVSNKKTLSSHKKTHSSTSAATVLNQFSRWTTAERQGALPLLLEVTNFQLLFSWKHGNC